MYVVGNLLRLDYLDDAIVTDAQRVQAETHKSIYTENEHHGTANQFADKFTGLNLFRNDQSNRSRFEKPSAFGKRRNKAKNKVATDSSSQG